MSQFFINGSGGGGGSVQTIDGDTGSATGSIITFTGVNAGSTVRFAASGSTVDLDLSDINNNTFLGFLAGNNTLSGASNTGVGFETGHVLTSGQNNALFGYGSGAFLTTGNFNCGIGSQSLNALTTGVSNAVLGYQSGSSYTSNESNNILITNLGTAGDQNIIRIGTQGSGSEQQNKCFIAGITGVTTTNTQMVTINTVTGQLGAAAISSGITGPGSSTNLALVTWNGTSGAIVQDTSGWVLSTSNTGALRGPSGNVSVPTFSFTAATQYGMYFASSAIRWTANGTNWMSLDQNGLLVNIGNTSLEAGFAGNPQNHAASFTAGAGEFFVGITDTSIARTVTLPASPTKQSIWVIKDQSGAAGTNNITVTVSGGVIQIDGATTQVISTNYGVLRVYWNATSGKYFTW